MLSSFCKLVATVVVVIGVSVPSVAVAGFLSSVTGIFTDPLKLSKSSENLLSSVERAAIHAERLQGEVDRDFRDYLEEIDNTIADTRNWISEERAITVRETDRIVSESFEKIAKLERSFFDNTKELVKCSGVVTANVLKGLIADSLNDLGQRKPRFLFFGFEIGTLTIDPADVPSPIAGYRRVRALYDAAIREVKESDPPSIITDAYAEIQRLADLTRCHYKEDTSVFQELYVIELEYNRRGRKWRGITSPI